MIVDLTYREMVASMPSGGAMGQISFTRLNDQLRAAGEIRPDEVITHLRIQVREGIVQYRVVKQAEEPSP